MLTKLKNLKTVLNTYEQQPPWRNWLARSAVNRKVGGSSPPGGGVFCFLKTHLIVFFLFFNQKMQN
jgi:hypothetical protein